MVFRHHYMATDMGSSGQPEATGPVDVTGSLLFEGPPADAWLDLDREVRLESIQFDLKMEHGQVRALDDQEVKVRVQSLRTAPPADIMGPDKFLLVPQDSVGMFPLVGFFYFPALAFQLLRTG